MHCLVLTIKIRGGEGGIRTHEALVAPTRSPGERLRPLGYLSTLPPRIGKARKLFPLRETSASHSQDRRSHSHHARISVVP